eukprot:142310_1
MGCCHAQMKQLRNKFRSSTVTSVPLLSDVNHTNDPLKLYEHIDYENNNHNILAPESPSEKNPQILITPASYHTENNEHFSVYEIAHTSNVKPSDSYSIPPPPPYNTMQIGGKPSASIDSLDIIQHHFLMTGQLPISPKNSSPMAKHDPQPEHVIQENEMLNRNDTDQSLYLLQD